jgi:NADH-quinone oxidoreductase subunit E
MAGKKEDKVKPARGIVEKYEKKEAGLIAILQDIQKERGYLPEQDLVAVAAEVKIPLSRIYALATFYKAFRLKPEGRHAIHVCLGTACHVRGGAGLLDRLEQDLGIRSGETTSDKRFTLNSVRCVGCCGLAPVVVIDGHFHGKLNYQKLTRILKKYP